MTEEIGDSPHLIAYERMSVDDLRRKWDEHYRSGPTPWDTGITPPEVQRFWKDRSDIAGGYALDIGCGSGLNVLFLAGQGLHAIGVDLSRQALMLAHRRLQANANRAAFVQADVSNLPFGPLGAVYALDIGCLHTLPNARRPSYAQGIRRVLRPGGYFHLYAFDRTDPSNERGMDPGEVAALFGDALHIVSEEQGLVSPRPSKRQKFLCQIVGCTNQNRFSHWYLLQKR